MVEMNDVVSLIAHAGSGNVLANLGWDLFSSLNKHVKDIFKN